MAIHPITLRDRITSATAKVAPEFGFNCYQFRAECAGQTVDVLWSVPDFETGAARASSSGIPILFPFPGRISQGVLKWQGKEIKLPAGDGRGNAIHGFVLNRPWRVTESGEDRVVGEFHASRDDKSLLELWPADFRIRVTYTLHNATLLAELTVDNPDTKPLPFGLGTHPYFRLPLGGKSADECLVKLPVTDEWELVELLPTGRRVSLADSPLLQQGKAFRELRLDNVFSGLVFDNKWCRSSMRDPQTNIVVEQSFDRLFRECVVYTPPHREALCIEPYTCVPGPFDLSSRGIDAGLRVLQPGESATGKVEISVRSGR